MSEREYNNKVLDKALQIIEALGYPDYVEMSIDELSQVFQIPKGTLMPYLKVFERHQWLEQTLERKWRVAPAVTRFSEGFRKMVAGRKAELNRMEKDHLGGQIIHSE